MLAILPHLLSFRYEYKRLSSLKVHSSPPNISLTPKRFNFNLTIAYKSACQRPRLLPLKQDSLLISRSKKTPEHHCPPQMPVAR